DKYGDLDSNLISFGPCQTPTLAFCVNRYDKITQFKPEPYWVIHLEVDVGQRAVKLDWERGRIFERDIAQLFLNRVKKHASVTIADVTSKENRKEKPSALSTVEMLRVASSALGMSPSQTMSIAEHLYTRGYISYPRTETTSYPAGFDFNSVLRQLSGTSNFGGVARQ
ncbi:DNA topoisomerase, partial [Aphelenchoides avenae]